MSQSSSSKNKTLPIIRSHGSDQNVSSDIPADIDVSVVVRSAMHFAQRHREIVLKTGWTQKELSLEHLQAFIKKYAQEYVAFLLEPTFGLPAAITLNDKITALDEVFNLSEALHIAQECHQKISIEFCHKWQLPKDIIKEANKRLDIMRDLEKEAMLMLEDPPPGPPRSLKKRG